MTKLLIHGKTSADFAAAMLTKPQNRQWRKSGCPKVI